MEKLDPDFLEKIILKTILKDKDFLILISRVFKNDYFDNTNIGEIFSICKKYIEDYKEIPPKDIIIHTSKDKEENRNEIKNIIEEVESIDFDIAKNYKFILIESNDYLKTQALKIAISNSIDIVQDNNGDKQLIRKDIEDALCKNLTIDLGLKYFDNINERLLRILKAHKNRIPTYFPKFDEFINGGFPPFTLSVIVAKIHSGKSNTMINMAARQVLHGHNVVILTLEMGEDANAQRFDSIYSLADINRIYQSKQNVMKLRKSLRKIENIENRGELYIKQFPTGTATVTDFRVYLRELIIRGIQPHIIYVDYINLMKSAMSKSLDLYSSVKAIAEELRALSYEFKIPVVSVSQLNREGGFVGLENLDFNHISESMGLGATVDFLSIIGTMEDAMIYENEIFYKIVKNRLGGRIGEIDKFYFDARSLKMYCSTELNLWENDAKITNDERNIFNKRNG